MVDESCLPDKKCIPVRTDFHVYMLSHLHLIILQMLSYKATNRRENIFIRDPTIKVLQCIILRANKCWEIQ